MKKRCIRTVLCLLAAILLLAGCKSSGQLVSDVSKPVSSAETGLILSTTDPETPDCDYAIISFHPCFLNVTNAEGGELHWSADSIYPPVGSIEHFGYRVLGLKPVADIWVPYSESFTVQTRVPQNQSSAEFGAQFNRDSFWVSDLSVIGNFEGTLTLSDDNTMKLNGKHSHIQAHFWVYEEEGRNIKTGKYRYILDADAGENTQIRLEGDELIAEGIVGKYTVTKYEYSESSLGGQEIYTKVYNADA